MKGTINKILDSKVPIIIIGIIAFIFFSYKNIRYYYHLGNYSEETVARVFDVSRSGNARYLDYSYQIGDKEFKSSRALGNNCGKCKLGKYFRLEYSYKDPTVSKLYFDEESTDPLEIRSAGFDIN